MKTIRAQHVIEAVKELCVKANYCLPPSVTEAIRACREAESWGPAQNVLDRILENGEIAREGVFPACQDTGITCVFVELGQDAHVEGNLKDAVDEGVRRACAEGYLRRSVVSDPLSRVNTGDNAPAIISFDLVGGDKLKLTVAPKGAGSENMSRLVMLKPSDGRRGVIDFAVETVRLAGSNPCPPVVVGVGIGGSFDQVAALAKKALLRPLGQPHPERRYAELESEILAEINRLGIGPAGFGGDTTALAVAVEYRPTHIAMLPVAVNINCHVARFQSAVLEGEDHADPTYDAPDQG
ncbi:MAG: L(+)-tartrate dehydratase subunit alpha [Firmicutes bacterium ADurb.Bin248]|nr:MAG: L(+)-tartrate dehydratase subunit alpha [Firmicutes bacterium ADurb.Bin248]HOG01121.1 fumarate hydratase [Clostridia bacterium]HPK16437.1 fumarate hydratase [Clostridia bacterium]